MLPVTPIAGRDPDYKMLQTMIKEAPGPLNFTMFLMLFGEKVKGEFRSDEIKAY